MARKPTIHELEQLLESEEDTPIEILPNGRSANGEGAMRLNETSRSP